MNPRDGHALPEHMRPLLDWAEDTLTILLRDDLECSNDAISQQLTYFEKLIIVRDLSRLLKQSNKICSAITTLEQH